MRPIAPAVFALILILPWLPGCESSPDPERSPIASWDTGPAPDLFSAERAWHDLERLVAIGPRVSGTAGASRAREYLSSELEKIGAEVREIETLRQIEGIEDVTLRHVSAVLPGASPRILMLVAPYDSSRFGSFEFVGANDGASGAALLLELARVLSTRSLPYTTQLLFLDGEGRADGDSEGPAAERWHGSQSVAEQMSEAGELGRIRLLVAFHQVCDADLRIARDLFSHRMHREEFFKAARRVGRPEFFPIDQGFESLEASHRAFRERGVRGAVGLSDTRYGGDAVPGAYSESVEDTLEHCSPASLESVGVIALAALDTIGRRLAKIDRFIRAPLAEVESVFEAPEAEPVPDESDEPAELDEHDEPAEPADPAETVESVETPAGNDPIVSSESPTPEE